jgi:hypothetical protein
MTSSSHEKDSDAGFTTDPVGPAQTYAEWKAARQGTTPSCTPEVCTPTEGETLLQEALAEMTSTVRDEAKAVIQERIREIQHLEVILAKAKADLQALTQRPAAEIAMGVSSKARGSLRPLGDMWVLPSGTGVSRS